MTPAHLDPQSSQSNAVFAALEQHLLPLVRVLAQTLDTPIACLQVFQGGQPLPPVAVGLEAHHPTFVHSLASNEVLVIPDLRNVPLFEHHEMVLGSPRLRFYAGVNLRSKDGFNLGTLFVLDSRLRASITPGQREAFEDLAKTASALLELQQQHPQQASFQDDHNDAQGLRVALSSAKVLLANLDAKGQLESLDGQGMEWLGLGGRALGRSVYETITHADTLEAIGRALGGQESRVLVSDGVGVDKRVFELRCIPLTDAGHQTGVTVLGVDVSDFKRTEEQLAHQASHDPLTALPNRVLYMDRLQHALARAGRDAQPIAVCFVDLDRFKLVNDTLGHAAGDVLLLEVSKRLLSCVREGDTVSRFAGDEFTLILPGVRSPSAAERMAEKILMALKQPYDIDRNNVVISASVGISIYPYDGEDAESLLKNADIALYRAKNAGKDGYQLYTRELAEADQVRVELENHLRFALERQELHLEYQPQFDLQSNRVVGMEALLRWKHPELGNITPKRFLPVAELSGLIVPIGAWVLGEACRAATTWQYFGYPAVRVSVNVSSLQFRRADFVKTVARALESSHLEPSLLQLELNEDMVFESLEESTRRIRELRALGVRVTIDHFPHHYASLGRLEDLPVNTLKIAGPATHEPSNGPHLLETLIAMARNSSIQVVAEGIETEPQMALLRQLGCDEAQGYLLASPMTGEAVQRLLSSERRELGDGLFDF